MVSHCLSSLVHSPLCLILCASPTVALKDYSSYTLSQLTLNLVGSVRVTCRSKIAKIVLMGNPKWLPWWPSCKSIFLFFSQTKRPTDLKLGGSIRVTCRSKVSKIVLIRIQDGHHGRHLENLFLSSSEPKGQFT